MIARLEQAIAGMTPRRAFQMIVIALLALVFFLPLYWVVISSLRPEDDIFRFLSPLSIWTFIPNRLTFANILGLWTGPFARAIFNSLFVAIVTVIGGLAVCAPAAFALAVIGVIAGGRAAASRGKK